MIKLNSFIIGLLLVAGGCFGQSSPQTVNQAVEWSAINSTIKISDRLGVYAEGIFRFAKALEPQQHQFRTALEVTLGKNLSVIPVGYVYTWNFRYGDQPVAFANNEHRIYQQVTYKHSLNRFYVNHRVRFEERFLQDRHVTTEGMVEGGGYHDDRYRLRYRALVNMPINNNTMIAKTWFVSVWGETFVSWGKKVTYHEPDQNRVYCGIGYNITKLITVQAGGIYQMLKKSNGTLQENNVGGVLQFTYNFDLTKAK